MARGDSAMSAENTTYEIQACSTGPWQTLGIFSDASDAIAEAVRLRRSNLYMGIRVTEEAYMQAAGTFASRIVYRYSREPQLSPVAVAPSATSPAALRVGLRHRASVWRRSSP
jgi:hypothetical protein